MAPFHKSLFIFRRDLRLEDNTGLLAALGSSDTVIPCFIYDPRQLKHNPYRSENAVHFMNESLEHLNGELKKYRSRLYIFNGQPDQVIETLIAQEAIRAVFVNRDYTPFSIHRDLAIQFVCQKHQIPFHSTDDGLLFPPEKIKKENGEPYSIYSAFLKKAQGFPVPKPVKNRFKNYYSQPMTGQDKVIKPNNNQYLAQHGGRAEALKILKTLKRFKNYDLDRNFPAIGATTGLSAHHKFGTCSIREVYHAIKDELGVDHTLIRELFWRDFFTYVGFHFPNVLGSSFHEKYDRIHWENNEGKFKVWCEGKTGFPIVDAGMRELNATGFMHNRVRMIVASFLTKDLHIDWRWGEKYFAQKLVDYDPLVNNGNWQWAASTGCDAQPYFRIFNPWLQQQRFDPECLYIKRWIPQIKNLEPKQIHRFYELHSTIVPDYPAPMVDHQKESQKAKSLFRRIRQ